MVAITRRADLSRGLTNDEIDANMTNLKTAAEAAALSASWSGVTGKPTTVAGYGITDAQAPLVSGTNIKTVNGQPVLGAGDLALATASHNHDAAYLGKTAKAADSELLDGFNSTAFLRAVNGVGPDANGNVTVNVDLSSRVAKSGDTMTGRLTLPSATITSTAPQIDFTDTDQGTTRYLHVNGNLMGFLNTGGGWDMYANNSGQVWAANYGWLHDRFAAKSAEAALDRINNCSWNCAALNGSATLSVGVSKSGTQLYVHTNNCNCQCNG